MLKSSRDEESKDCDPGTQPLGGEKTGAIGNQCIVERRGR